MIEREPLPITISRHFRIDHDFLEKIFASPQGVRLLKLQPQLFSFQQCFDVVEALDGKTLARCDFTVKPYGAHKLVMARGQQLPPSDARTAMTT